MTYATAVQEFVQAAEAADLPVTLSTTPLAANVLTSARTVFGDTLSATIQQRGYPGGAEIPWTVEELYLYEWSELDARQAGYRTEARTSEPSEAWDKDKYVIADWMADPVSIDRDGSVWYSRHGTGTWHYLRLADDLPSFLSALARWLRFFVVQHGGNLFNDDFVVPQGKKDDLREEMLDAEGIEHDRFIAFALGEI